ncbi:hypothetical protein C7S10_04720 [Nocardioides currus]|uniref:Uncharacterized protein n=1 Tax=Nocardioides currus TaxID=2133958 RepID=A0A2R7Z3N3_9ACTN|nr:hypothetical protein C7S10_04720 [Nocardioides currus]
MDSVGAARAWGWVAHLRDGGATPWADWTGGSTPSARVLPGAQQLELLRRLNASTSPVEVRAQRASRPALADRVLTAAAPGRGKPDLPLVGVEASPYGPQPVDPAQLPAHELVRVATSVLAEDVVALGVPAPARRLRRPWHRAVRLAGDPVEAAHLRDHLAGLGRPPGGPGSRALVIGAPLDELLADVWTRRCFERGSGAWLEWLRFWQQRGELPPRIDLPAVVDRHRPRHRDVQVVLDRDRLPDLLGVRRLPPVVRPGADAAELARRIATVVGLLVPPDERADLMTHTLLPRMPATGHAPVGLPAEHREWVSAAAQRMVQQLRRGGYPVVGDPAVLVPAEATDQATGPASDEAVLDLAVRMLVDDTWKEQP